MKPTRGQYPRLDGLWAMVPLGSPAVIAVVTQIQYVARFEADAPRVGIRTIIR
jgi:hypothetical protein